METLLVIIGILLFLGLGFWQLYLKVRIVKLIIQHLFGDKG